MFVCSSAGVKVNLVGLQLCVRVPGAARFGLVRCALMPPKIRGGRHQRAAALAAAADGNPLGDVRLHVDNASPLGRALLQKWAWGELSAVAVQSLAHAACLSGLECGDVRFLASLGSYGRQPGNCHVGIITKFCRDLHVPPPFSAQVPLSIKVGLVKVVAQKPVDVLLPHDWFASLDKADASNKVLGFDNVSAFWDGQNFEDPKFSNGVVQNSPGFRNRLVPLVLHGDGVAFQNKDSLMAISMRSVLSEGSIKDSQMLLAAIPKRCRCKSRNEDTWQQLWKILAWSLTALFHGVHPDTDHNGEPFPHGTSRSRLAGTPLARSGARGLVYAISGDMDWLANEMNLAHPSSLNPCFKCACNVDEVPWNDFREAAAWRATVKTPAQNLAQPPTRHIILTVPGIVAESFALDMMHVIDLGISLHVLGNVLFYIIFDVLRGHTWDSAVQIVFEQILGIYQELGTPHSSRLAELKMENICVDRNAPHQNYPMLRSVKARETRYLVPVVLQLIKRYRDGTDQSSHMCECVEHLSTLCNVVDAGGLFLDATARSTYAASTHALLLHYTWLARHALETRMLRWSVVQKFHYCAHMPAQAQFVNPRTTWAYGGESMVGTISSLGHSCLRGTASQRIPAKIVAKYRIAFHLRLRDQID